MRDTFSLRAYHWLILVGAHTIPELTVEIDFAKL